MHRLSLVWGMLILMAFKTLAQSPECPAIQLPANGLVVTEANGDVTGDGVADIVMLVGIHDEPIAFAGSHQLLIYDRAKKQVIPFPLAPESGGYPGTLFLGRFNEDRAADILVGIPTGGSGGITRYFLATAVGGQPAYLIDPVTLNNGPAMQVALANDFKAQVSVPSLNKKFVLDLRQSGQSAQELLRTYRGVYSAQGQLLQPTTGTVDPYGVMEPVDRDKNGIYELAGYQGIWVVYHANMIGVARSVWAWRPAGFAVVDVAVSPSYNPGAYQSDLKSLSQRPPSVAVPQAIAAYQQRFALAPPVWRGEGFMQFRTVHQRLVLAADRQFQQQYDAAIAQGGPFPAQAVQQLVNRFNADPANQRSGFQAVYQGEAKWSVVPRQGFYPGNFGPYLTPDYREFLVLEDIETHQGAGMSLPMTDLGRRLRNWEQYLERYPGSPFRAQAQAYYRTELSAFLYGTEENPHFDPQSGQLRPEVTPAMQQYIAQHPGTASAREVSGVLAIYARHNNTMSAALRADLEQFRRLHDPTIASSYFPATVGDAWRYATGGFENAGYQMNVAYRQGNRVQFNIQDTATSGFAIYNLQDDNVVVVNRTGEAKDTGNHLDLPNAMNQMLLQSPIRVNRAWRSNGVHNVIARTNATLVILGKPYIDVIEIVRTPYAPGAPAYEIHDFYALGVGHIRRDYLATGLINQALLCAYQPAVGQ